MSLCGNTWNVYIVNMYHISGSPSDQHCTCWYISLSPVSEVWITLWKQTRYILVFQVFGYFQLSLIIHLSEITSWRGYLLLWTLVLGLGYSNLLAFLTNFYLQGMKTWLRPQISLNPAIWISPRIKCLLYQVGCTEIKRVHNSYSIKTSF